MNVDNVLIDRKVLESLVSRAAGYEQHQDQLRRSYDPLIKWKPYEEYLSQIKKEIEFKNE